MMQTAVAVLAAGVPARTEQRMLIVVIVVDESSVKKTGVEDPYRVNVTETSRVAKPPLGIVAAKIPLPLVVPLTVHIFICGTRPVVWLVVPSIARPMSDWTARTDPSQR